MHQVFNEHQLDKLEVQMSHCRAPLAILGLFKELSEDNIGAASSGNALRARAPSLPGGRAARAQPSAAPSAAQKAALTPSKRKRRPNFDQVKTWRVKAIFASLMLG